MEVRYFYTTHGSVDQTAVIDSAILYTPNSVNVTGAAQGAIASGTFGDQDTFVSYTFSSAAGTLAPGEIVELQSRVHKSDWSFYDQSNDYSFNDQQEYSEWIRPPFIIKAS